ncbi:putative steroid-binding protein 3 [Psilocybe cubensis]|uniref:Cytochrome b5 heme-binding domain-containing protein n=2 Tax=Psilocybe cubensis TaxID=181762 RepID=A0A8H8CNU3_PSICU|nr:putative steroid-binding protein 3 [Psilocybe cubensis]KAH9484742.1 putative steroid-binding protein 3 [Psilocybe cubensis]
MLSLVKYLLLLVLPVSYLLRRRFPSLSFKLSSSTPVQIPAEENPEKPLKTIMQAPRDDLAPPKDDPFTTEELKQYDGSDPTKPIYVAIKGTVFDVSSKKDVYGPGRSYSVFSGKDGSRGLGMSSLKPEDAVADYSTLDAKDMKVLDDWHAFFSKRYNIVGRVTDGPVIESQ